VFVREEKRNEDGEIPPMELNDLAIVGPLMFSKRGSIAACYK